MSLEHPTRRRAITIFAATAAGLCLGATARARPDYEWRGTAMGSYARIVFSGADPALAQKAAAAVEAEIERLEGALSLFRPQSEICRLNWDGRLAHPSADFRRCLSLALAVAEATNGLFDPTVQAFWETYADWFVRDGRADPVPAEMLDKARAQVDWRKIGLRGDSAELGPGQRITLNGLGQGYVTDRVADQLRAAGYRHVLVDLGEQRALGAQSDGQPWQVARAGAEPIPLADQALATSEGAGCVLNARLNVHHLFDPRSGDSARHWRRMIVSHAQAALADALSTALYIAHSEEIRRIVEQFPGARAWGTAADGSEQVWASA